MAKVTLENQSAASVPTPASGRTTVFVDSADKHFKIKDDTGAVTDTSVPGSAITSLTGDVTATGPGAAAATVTNASVIAKVLTGYSASSGTLSSSDSILTAFNKLGARLDCGWFGTGNDGTATISVDTTLIRDMYYSSLQINTGATLFTAGYRVHVLGDFTIQSGAFVDRSGNNATLSLAGAGQTAGTIGAGSAGGVGGGVGAGTAGSGQTTCVGGAGGAGGAGAFAGGAGGAATVPVATVGGVDALYAVRQATVARDITNVVMTPGCGGGGGGGSGAASSGGGGGGGAGIIVIMARNLTGSGTIRAIGGSGGNANIATGGGGGGGGGGTIVLVTENDTTTTSLTVSVTGGSGGAGNTTGLAGATGANGRIYRVRT